MTTTNSCYPIQDAMQRFFPSYDAENAVSTEQGNAAVSIMACKTGKLGYSVSTCEDCGYKLIHNRSCNNRNCPCCQGYLQDVWVDARNSEMISTISYFHVIFTVPAELNALIYRNQKQLYTLLFHTTSKTLLELSADPEYLGAEPGIVSVLHSWGANLSYHPHIHALVSGGGLTSVNQFKTTSHKDFFLPVAVISRLFRGKFLAELKKLYEQHKIEFPESHRKLHNTYEWKEFIDQLYTKEWVPFIKETFNGNGNAIKYLARYAYRTAISNRRIIEVTDETVTFEYKNYKKGGTMETMTLDGHEFVHRFLMHILPKGFTRIRFSGYLSNCKKSRCLKLIRKRTGSIEIRSKLKGLSTPELMLELYQVDLTHCPCCNKTLKIRQVMQMRH